MGCDLKKAEEVLNQLLQKKGLSRIYPDLARIGFEIKVKMAVKGKKLGITEDASNENRERPNFDKLPEYVEGQSNMVYAGIGSRETPVEILTAMNKVAKKLEDLGYTLRSGGAIGADSAFEGSGVLEIEDRSKLIASLKSNAKSFKDKYLKTSGDFDPKTDVYGMRWSSKLPDGAKADFGNPFSKWTVQVSNNDELSAMFYNWVVKNKVPASYNGDLEKLGKSRFWLLKNMPKLTAVLEGKKKLYYKGTAVNKDLSHASTLMRIAKGMDFSKIGEYINKPQTVEKGLVLEAVEDKEIFTKEDATENTRAIAKEIHAAGGRLKGDALDLMARNTNQVFGRNLDTPVDFVLAWTPLNKEGKPVTSHEMKSYDPDKKTKLENGESTFDTGGTGQAISYASLKGIPVINMADPKWEDQLDSILETEKNGKTNIKKVEAPKEETTNKSSKVDSLNIYSGTGENSELSNFAIRPFEHMGIKFKSVEQAFQAYKAEFADKSIEQNKAIKRVIMETTDGGRLRALGREFKKFDKVLWDKQSSSIMKALIKDSFSQNPEALKMLLATGDKELTHTQDKSKWGKEFPKLLMEVRAELENEVKELKAKDKESIDTEKQVDKKGSLENLPKEELDKKLSNREETNKYELYPGVYANKGQEQAIDNIKEWFDSKQPTYLLKGRGGTGKTTIVNKVLEELKLLPSAVMFATPTNKAKVVIETANKGSAYKSSVYTTSASLLNYREVGDGKFEKQSGSRIVPPEVKLEAIKVLVVDEVSMLNSRHKKELEEAASDAGTKILYMGDNVQLPPVNDFVKGIQVKESVVFSEHKKQGKEVSELNERMRQGEESPILSVTDSLAESVENGKAPYIDLSKVKEGSPLEVDNSSEENRLNKFVKAFKKDPQMTRWLMFNNQTNTAFGRRITQTVREAVYGDKAKEPIVNGEQLYMANPFVHEEEGSDEKQLVYNGMEATVDSVNYDYLETSFGNNKIGTYKVKVPVAFVSFTDNLTGVVYRGVPVRIPATTDMVENLVAGLKRRGKPDHAKSARALYYKMADKVSFAGVINAHKSQGSTYNTVFVDVRNIKAMPGDNDTVGKALYVATSRPRERLVLMNIEEQGAIDKYEAEAETKYDDDIILDKEAYEDALEAFNRCSI